MHAASYKEILRKLPLWGRAVFKAKLWCVTVRGGSRAKRHSSRHVPARAPLLAAWQVAAAVTAVATVVLVAMGKAPRVACTAAEWAPAEETPAEVSGCRLLGRNPEAQAPTLRSLEAAFAATASSLKPPVALEVENSVKTLEEIL